MSIYAIGDVQGCYEALSELLETIRFDAGKDRLWFVGDLVNRGKDSVSVLRFVRNLGPRAVTVLGNHDIHLLARACGAASPKQRDTLDEVLSAADSAELLEWLRLRSFVHSEHGYTLVHAGLLPNWSVEQSERLAREVEDELRHGDYKGFLRYHCAHELTRWSDDLEGFARLSVITSVFTRLRLCSRAGEMDFEFSGPPEKNPQELLPWFEIREGSSEPPIVFGHWSALGLHIENKTICLDSGCVWGGALTAMRLEDREIFQVRC